MVKFIKSKPSDAGGGPSSAIGIMRFFDADSKSPKLSPYFIVAVIVIVIILALILKATIFHVAL
ncbi:MAG: preprotein translocase subunit Sec61beta [archaeon]|jgi:preprotein translocase subunit Sec61beta